MKARSWNSLARSSSSARLRSVTSERWSKDELRPAKGVAENGKLDCPHQQGSVMTKMLPVKNGMPFSAACRLGTPIHRVQVVRVGWRSELSGVAHDIFLAASQESWAEICSPTQSAAVHNQKRRSNCAAFKDRVLNSFRFFGWRFKGVCAAEMSRKVTTPPRISFRPNMGWDQYSTGKLAPSLRQKTSSSM